VLRDVSLSSQSMDGGMQEMRSAADNLAQRTEEQAASLQETASALKQLTTAVRRTADGAGHARRAIDTTRSEAEQSADVVNAAISAMSKIEESSKQIGRIIGVIDEIAFQTNLLALNAGVEAARAGDAGRGFAVVAAEVRALAQRSAEAAKEIKTLILSSADQVAGGVDLVSRTGQALNRIAGQIAEVNCIVVEIASSAHEQAQGVEQVNLAISQMDQVTQQNAAMAEESTAATHTLARESNALALAIARFRIGPLVEHAGAFPDGSASASRPSGLPPARTRPSVPRPAPRAEVRGGAASRTRADHVVSAETKRAKASSSTPADAEWADF